MGNVDYFSLFGLPREYAIDGSTLEQRFRELQSRVHPDKHAHLGDSEKRQAMEQATEANAAFQTLKNPLQRAMYLLRLAGNEVAVENNTAMPTEFLIEQMELRENVSDARGGGDEDALDVLRRDLKSRMVGEYAMLGALLDQQKAYDAAADMVRRLMFQEKLLQEIDDALEAIEG